MRRPLTLITGSAIERMLWTACSIADTVRCRSRTPTWSSDWCSPIGGSDFPTALALLDPGVRVYPRSEEPGAKEVYAGHEGLFEYLGNWLGQWDDYEVEPTSFQNAPGDRVLVEMAERGHLKSTESPWTRTSPTPSPSPRER